MIPRGCDLCRFGVLRWAIYHPQQRNETGVSVSRQTVKFVPDEALPEGHDWMLLEVDGRRHLVIRESSARAALLDARRALSELVSLRDAS